MKIAQGGCVTSEIIKYASRNNDMDATPFMYFPCMVNVEKEGLNIPISKIYGPDYIKGKPETSKFIERTMDMDLNRKVFPMVCNTEWDYLIIELGSLVFPTYKVYYNDKWVYSVNIEAPSCYDLIGLKYERVELTDDIVYKGLEDLAVALRDKLDPSKIIIFRDTEPKFYMTDEGTVHVYPKNVWEYLDIIKLNKYVDYLHSVLPEAKIFQSPSLQISVSLDGNPRHVTEESKLLQGLTFREFLTNEDLTKEISEASVALQKTLQEKLVLDPIVLIRKELYGSY